MLKRAFAFTLAMLLFLCGSAMSEELGISNGGGVNFTSSPNEVIVSGGSFVGALDEVAPGWYSIAPADEVYTKASIFDCYSFDEPALLASYAWWEDGTSLLTTEVYPEEYVVPLWEGCLVLAGYCGGLEYNASTGEAAWEQYDDAPGRIRLEYVAPLDGSAAVPEVPAVAVNEAPAAAPVSEDPYLLYEDENIAVSYSNFYVEKIADSSYLKTELLLKNKTDRILNIGCDSVIVNGCAVDISKFVEVPADSTFLHEWTNGAEMFLKYRIDTVKTFAMVFEYHNADSYIAGKSIQTREIEIE